MESKHGVQQYAATLGVRIQHYHTNNGALNKGSIAQVLNIKTRYIFPQFHIFFDDDFTTTSARIKNKLPDK